MVSNEIAIVVFIIFAIIFPWILKWSLKRIEWIQTIDQIPGVKSYPLIGSAYHFFGVKREDLFELLNGMTRKYPMISRFWMGPVAEVDISKAEYIEKIISASKNMDKAYGYEFVKQWLGDGLLISSGEKWFNHRKILTPTFHFTILESFCDIFTEKSNILVDKLSEHCGNNKALDIYPYITKAALDIIGEAAMGVELKAQEKSENNYITSIYEVTELMLNRFLRPWLHPDIIFFNTNNGKKMKRCLNILHSFTENVIKERKQKSINQKSTKKTNEFGMKNRLAFLDMLLDTDLTDLEIREEVDTFMFEGHDTTAVGISWALLLLGLYPDVQQKVYEELQTIFQDPDKVITLHDLNEMKYLERVIKETLRLYPSVPVMGRILSEDVQLDQYKVPKGCTVMIEIYHLHRDKRFFPDPEKFDPDRFLPENTIDRHPYAYIPFSAGPRNCIGQKFAMYEQKSVISAILRNYKIKTVGSIEDVTVVSELVLRPLSGVPLILQRR